MQYGGGEVFSLTSHFQVVTPEPVGLEVEGERGVGLGQEQVDLRQLDPLPLKHGSENLPETQHTGARSGHPQRRATSAR